VLDSLLSAACLVLGLVLPEMQCCLAKLGKGRGKREVREEIKRGRGLEK